MAVTVNRSSSQVTPAPRQANAKTSRNIGTAIRYTLLVLIGLLLFLPFILAFLGTFKSSAEVVAFPPKIFPTTWHPENWARAWGVEIQGAGANIFARWFFNSFWLAILNTATSLFLNSLAAYAFARMDFPFKNVIFAFMIATMAIPGAITLIPGYVFFSKLHWVNTYWPLIVPKIVGAFGIFLLTQFFKSIPKELEEAATVDGASRFRTYWTIVLPMARPALITLAIISFQGSWNDFQGPLLFLRTPKNMTLTVGLGYFQGLYTIDWASILVGSMFNAIPILVLFFIFNKYYMQSGNLSGLAGQ
ncbi:MAG: carbohydrate ABC transporter permease [Herpetosiphon sp.]